MLGLHGLALVVALFAALFVWFVSVALSVLAVACLLRSRWLVICFVGRLFGIGRRCSVVILGSISSYYCPTSIDSFFSTIMLVFDSLAGSRNARLIAGHPKYLLQQATRNASRSAQDSPECHRNALRE